MAPTIPCFRSPRGHCAAAAADADAAITISSSGSDQSVANTLVIVHSSTSSSGGSQDQSFANTLVNLSSSATFSTGNVVIIVPDSSASGGGVEARGGQRSAPRRRLRLPSAGSGHVATTTSRRTAAAPHQCPSPCSVLSVRAPGGLAVAAAPPSSGGRGGGDDEEATSRPKRKVRYRKWDIQDGCKVLNTMAKLRRENMGVLPQSSVLHEKIDEDGGLRRRGVDVRELSEKVYGLKKKFFKLKAAASASGGRRFRNNRNRVLYEASREVWPEPAWRRRRRHG